MRVEVPMKAIAIICMLLDHFSKILGPPFDSYFSIDIRYISILRFRWCWMESLGRVSFPLFAFSISEGSKFTRDLPNYFFRVLLLACISQPFYSYAFSTSNGNVVFVLAAGLTFILFWESIKSKPLNQTRKYFLAGFVFSLTYGITLFLGCSYAVIGVPLILLFRYIPVLHIKRVISAFVLAWFYLFYASWNGNHYMIFDQHVGISYVIDALFAIGSLLLFKPYDQKKSKRSKNQWTYVLYPLHLYIFSFFANLLGGFVTN